MPRSPRRPTRPALPPAPPDHELKGSEVRLWQLVAERGRPGADRARIDRRIWDLFGERWAVMFTDLAGFSRGVAEFGITHFLQIIYEQKRVLLPIVAAHDGILIKLDADSLLAIFRRPQAALASALEMQAATRAWNRGKPREEQMLLGIGLGYGDVLRVGDIDVWGGEVNAASKLGEDRAQPYEVLATEAVRAAVAGDFPRLGWEELSGDIPGSAHNWRVRSGPASRAAAKRGR